jgi:hypothetical protein
MKTIIKRLLVALVILVLVFSPYLLIIDFNRYAPFVFLVWIVSIAYYLLMKREIDRRIEGKQNEDRPPGSP